MSGSFSDTRILVTGGAGFVGANLVRMLLGNGAGHVLVVDNLLSSERDNLPDDRRIEFIEGSIAADSVLAAISNSFDYVFHLATYHGNQSSIHDPIADHDNNTITTLKLLNHIKKHKRLKKVVYSAAGCAVAEKTEGEAGATSEDAPVSLNMDSPYSISKIAGEFYCVYFHKSDGLPTVRARFQNVYGPGEVLGAGKWRGTPATVWRNVVPTFIYKSLKKEALPLENAGESSRDFIFVEDICRGLMLAAEHGEPGGVYNLASGVETTIRALAETINRITGNDTPCAILPRRSWDNSIHRFGGTEKSRTALGFTAQTGLEEGLKRTVEWTKTNMRRIEACVAKHAEHMAAAVKS